MWRCDGFFFLNFVLGSSSATFEYRDGDVCMGYRVRSTTVHVLCAPKARFVNATEPQHCQYLMFVESPFVCPAATKLAKPTTKTHA